MFNIGELVKITDFSRMCGISGRVYTLFLEKIIAYNKENKLGFNDDDKVAVLGYCFEALEHYKEEEITNSTLNAKEEEIMNSVLSAKEEEILNSILNAKGEEKIKQIEECAKKIVKVVDEFSAKYNIREDEVLKMAKIYYTSLMISEEDIDNIVEDICLEYAKEKRKIKSKRK